MLFIRHQFIGGSEFVLDVPHSKDLFKLLELPYLLLPGGGAGPLLASNQSKVGVAEGTRKAVGLLGVRNRLKIESCNVL